MINDIYNPKLKLPDTLSSLIRAAVNDCKVAEAAEGYVLDMGAWHYTNDDMSKCSVCMAGAVMARRLNALKLGFSFPSSCFDGPGGDSTTADKLRALECVRTGDLRGALNLIGELGSPNNLVELEWLISSKLSFDKGNHAPWNTYLRVARELGKEGY